MMHVNFKPMGGDLVGGLPNPAASMLQAQIFGPKSPFNEYLNAKSLTNKTLNACIAKGTWTASGTWVIPALTLGGMVILNSQVFSGAAAFSGGNTTVGGTGGLRQLTVTKAGAEGLEIGPGNVNGDASGAITSVFYDRSGGSYIKNIMSASQHQFQYAGSDVLTLSATSAVATVPVIMPSYTVATLPAGTVGMRAYVTDALAPTYNAVLVGGGAIKVPAFYNGTAWVSA